MPCLHGPYPIVTSLRRHAAAGYISAAAATIKEELMKEQSTDYRGTAAQVIVRQGQLRLGTSIRQQEELGVFSPHARLARSICCGQVGYLTCSTASESEAMAGGA